VLNLSFLYNISIVAWMHGCRHLHNGLFHVVLQYLPFSSVNSSLFKWIKYNFIAKVTYRTVLSVHVCNYCSLHFSWIHLVWILGIEHSVWLGETRKVHPFSALV
jgi:hypothetical protein